MKQKTVTKVTKEMKTNEICQMIDAFQTDFKEFKMHSFNTHQHSKVHKASDNTLQKD